MTEQIVTPTMTDPGMTEPTSSAAPEKASLRRVMTDQRKTFFVALGLAVATYWIAGQLGEWRLAGCVAAGIALGLANHVATEYWLLKTITSGQQPSRNEMIAATLVRLAALSLVAVAIAVYLWPDGIGLLLGLAIFRLIALVMTSVPLLKELNHP